jgi:predicted PurR-regulated permease PerM
MPRVKLELDTTPNLAKRILFEIYRFFAVPIDLFDEYFKRFKIKKASRFYNLVNYRLSDYIFGKVVHAIIVMGTFLIGLVAFEFDERTIIITCSLIGFILYFPSLVKILFISSIIFIEFIFRVIKASFFTLKSLFTESVY